MTNNIQNNEVAIREVALAFSQQKVTATVKKIEASFERRDDFEALNGLVLASKNSYTTERDRMLKNKVAVARFMLALEVEPSAVIERKVTETSMFNAKALKKVTELAQFVCGYGAKVERVLKAFIACAMLATDKQVEVITNTVNAKFLNSEDLERHIADADLLEGLATLRATHMSSGAATQSSQCRNVLDVLGLGSIQNVEKPRDAIVLYRDHAFYNFFASKIMKRA